VIWELCEHTLLGIYRISLIVRKEDIVITIRRLKIDEANLLKQMRLTSLRDAPYAFPSTYEAALQRSAESWSEQAERTAQGTDRATFTAFSENLPVGMAALYRREDKVDVGELLQVWVTPEHRGTGISWDLMDTIFKWARENSFCRIIAGVKKVNVRALKFYRKYGFSIFEETSANNPNGVYLVKAVSEMVA
jgi:GNAT superfamily N-acetyltransferase